MAYTDIDKPDLYFNTKLYTGNGSTQSISSVGFQPDMTWIKNRGEAVAHVLFDSVRGAGGNKELTPNETYAEGGNSTISYGFLSSFDSDGFSVSNGTSSPNQADYVNKSSINYTSWNWLASNTTASNTDGSITSTVSANTTSGFSIVSYTGTGANATVGHGLGVAPSMIIIKGRSYVDNWPVYHSSLGNTKKLRLNLTNAEATNITNWNNTSPTSSVFSIGTNGEMNNNGGTIIAYCFAEKKGFSSFGSYVGNGSTNGTFVYTGFKPAFVLIKVTSTTNDWEIHDNKRGSSNVINAILQPNLSDAESTSGREIDFLSNGFKLRNSGSQNNLSGGTFIYMAFAESPFTTSTGIPTTAR